MNGESLKPSAAKDKKIEEISPLSRLIVVMSGASMAYEIDPERRKREPGWEPGPHTNDEASDVEWKFPLVLPIAGAIPEGETRGTRRDISGGWSRMRGLQSLLQHDDGLKSGAAQVLVTGGMEKDVTESGEEIQTSRADEAARVLVNRYGLPENAVVSIGGPGSTLGNSYATSEYIREHPEYSHITEVDAVTNDYHMLRTWIMFSTGFLKMATGQGLEVIPEDVKNTLKEILNAASTAIDRDDWKSEQIKQTREQVMEILKPYFANATIRVHPLVAEELIEQNDGDAGKRYAARLRIHPRTRDMLKREYKGIQDLLDGTYKGKF